MIFLFQGAERLMDGDFYLNDNYFPDTIDYFYL